MDLFIDKIKKLKEKTDQIFIYGAGLYGQRVYKIFRENNICVQGIVVTNDTQCNKEMFDLQVQLIENVDLRNAGIVVGANRHNSIEISKVLRDRHINDSKILYACEYLDNRKIEGKYYSVPTIEITTVIGCKINCKYCPQDLLIKSYFQNNPRRDSIMTLDTFITCLNHLPEKCNIQFCGMAEPFLNPLCSEMIHKAVDSGRNIELYTTLVGLTQEELERIWDISMDFVNIHVADINGYADISVTEEYLDLFENAVNHTRKDGRMFVNACNSQGEPHPYIKELCKGRFDISTSLHDRAGNLEAKNLIHKQNNSGILSCTLCGQELNHNVLLPDGTLLLCCMDYGMKHELGNLKEETYEDIIQGRKLGKIKEGLMGREDVDILCRSCSNATKIN